MLRSLISFFFFFFFNDTATTEIYTLSLHDALPILFAIGGVFALLMRTELARPGKQIFSPHAYNQLFTLHGTLMIFLVIFPLLAGFGNYFVPLQIGALDMAFPR